MNRTFLRHIHLTVILAVMLTAFAACIEDSISTSPADQPEFSTDTLRFGTQYSDEVTPTMMLMVYNRHDKVMSISDISIEGDDGVFRLNVDGFSGTRFSGVEIRPNDSIYVLVSARFPTNGDFEPARVDRTLTFTTNGVTRKVVLTAESQDVERLTDPVITADTRWRPTHPRRIYGRLTVAPGATLTLEAGTTLLFHDKASVEVEGRLVCLGTAEQPVVMRGDRLGSVVGDISFDLLASQWHGVRLTPQSAGNELSFTEIRNTVSGLTADTTDLALVNCRLRNSAGRVLTSNHSTLRAVGSEFAEAAEGAVLLCGGSAEMVNCTFSNYYLFAAITGALLQVDHTDADHTDGSTLPYLSARIVNSILYGSSGEMNRSDLTGTDVYVTSCLMRSKGTDDDHFIRCLWDTDPLFYTVRSEYLFDYRLQPDSPAIGASQPCDTQLPATDFYGTPHPSPASLGAYEPRPDGEENP